jgi:hypothetical protein
VVVRIEQRLDRTLADELPRNSRGDAVGCHVGQHLVFQLGRIGAALADQIAVQPLLSDALELAKQMQLGVFSRVAPLGHQEMGGQFVEDLRRPHVAGVGQRQVDGRPDDPGVLSLRRARQDRA